LCWNFRVRKWFDSSAYYLRPPEYSEGAERDEERRPRRTNSRGSWGGLRFTVTATNDTPPDVQIPPGIIVSTSRVTNRTRLKAKLLFI
jgi:hypothetical protein